MAEIIETKMPPMPAKSDMGSDIINSVNTSAIAEYLPLGILVCHITPANIVETLFINEFACNIFHLTNKIVLPCSLETICHANDSQVLASQIQEVYRSKTQSNFEWSIQPGQSTERYLNSELIPLKNSNGEVFQVICTIEDHTAEKLAERNLLHHAFHDALTGQPNRVLFRNKLEEAVANCQRAGNTDGCAVLIINIDRFQQINGSFGHSAGDRFLISMASTLRRCIKSNDTLARLSGDEFAILVSQFDALEEVEAISKQIHATMEQPYDLDGNEVFISVSIGISSTISSSTHPEDLIRDADFAMHRAKHAGKSRTEIYRHEPHRQARSQFHLETELRRAVERRELELYYQPIVDMKTGELRSFEGLTRWIHKDKGFVAPNDFIPLAEETGVIVKLGQWALMEACQQAKVWINAVGEDRAVPINVNVSGIQFARDDVASMIENALEKTDVPGKFIRVELTESAIMANPTLIAESLTRIRNLGVKVALDDFGTGYSSLNYLHQFPIDIIKIDRSFINQLEIGNQPYKILEMIGVLSESLGHDLVVEGLEDLEQVIMLRDMGFPYAQGYFYSKPVNSAAATKIVLGPLPWGTVPEIAPENVPEIKQEAAPKTAPGTP
ncbi:MAG: GGDEF domain-containing protein [Kordiimonadaceae bacterium]|nr:GGDEF domain-containing protein [Kordiimonadaceae bacterium]